MSSTDEPNVNPVPEGPVSEEQPEVVEPTHDDNGGDTLLEDAEKVAAHKGETDVTGSGGGTLHHEGGTGVVTNDPDEES